MTAHLSLAPATLDREELAELRATVRDAVAESGYPAGVRELEGDDAGIDADLWRLLAQEIGLAGVGLPESAGGLGGMAEVLAVAEELGAGLAPVPFLTIVLSGQILAACGSDPAQHAVSEVAGGAVIAPAITDHRGRFTLDGIAPVLDGANLTGTVRFVPHGGSASSYVVAARGTDGDVAVVLVAADADGVTATPLSALDFSRPVATVSFTAAPCTLLATGSAAEDALRHGVDMALLATGADQLGGAQRCFDLTLDYIKLRRQFNREIGSFQAIKHRMADALAQVEMMRSGLERVTWDERENLSVDAATVKAWNSDAYLAIAAETVQLHGGVGFTWEHDAHLYFRRARYDDAFLGNATFQRERLADLLTW
jgi:alkylation response protein AidB-like acyl-CoA dehydrogenase